MNNFLLKNEREIIVKYLNSEKPNLLIKNIETGSIPSEIFEAKFAPLEIKAQSYEIKNDVIFFERAQNSRILADKAKILVYFYYKGRSLFFETQFFHNGNFFCLPISSQIYKQTEKEKASLPDIICHIWSSDFIQANITCTIDENFSSLNENCENLSENFFNYDFPADVPILENKKTEFVLLFIDDKKLTVGSFILDETFDNGMIYECKIVVPSVFCNRTIFANVKCTNVLQNKNRIFYEFSFENLKLEDQRFLFEKIYKTPFLA